MTSAHALLTLATQLYRETQFLKAIGVASQLLEQDPGTPTGWAIRGLSRQAIGETSGALEDLQRALSLDPTSHKARLALAQCLSDTDEPEAALQQIDFLLAKTVDTQRLSLQSKLRRQTHWPSGALAAERQILTLDPANQGLRRRVAQTAHREGDPEQAREILSDTTDPLTDEDQFLFGQISYELGDVDAARLAAQATLKQTTEPDMRFRAAHLLFQAGPFSVAAAAFRGIVNAADPTLKSLTWYGRCLIFSCNSDAKVWTETLLTQHPNHADVQCMAGVFYASNGQHQLALEHFQKALQLDETLSEAHLWMGEFHRNQGSNKDALSAIDTGIFHTPEYSIAGELNRILTVHGQYQLGLGWRKMPLNIFKHHVERCAALIDKDVIVQALKTQKKQVVTQACTLALEALQGNRTGWPTRPTKTAEGAIRVHLAPDVRQESRRCQLLLQTRSPRQVIDAFTPLLEQFPDSPAVLCHRGEVALWMGDYDEAENDFDTALRLNPNTRWAWIGLGASQILKGNETEGLSTFARSKKHACPGRTMWVYQGEAYWRIGDLHKAEKHIEEALAINPERTSAHVLRGLLHIRQGNSEEAFKEWTFLYQQNRTLCRQVCLANQLTERPDLPVTIEILEQLLAELLNSMRGNRASTVITWFHRDAMHIQIHEPVTVTAQYGL